MGWTIYIYIAIRRGNKIGLTLTALLGSTLYAYYLKSIFLFNMYRTTFVCCCKVLFDTRRPSGWANTFPISNPIIPRAAMENANAQTQKSFRSRFMVAARSRWAAARRTTNPEKTQPYSNSNRPYIYTYTIYIRSHVACVLLFKL